jgi:hypothetical protein
MSHKQQDLIRSIYFLEMSSLFTHAVQGREATLLTPQHRDLMNVMQTTSYKQQLVVISSRWLTFSVSQIVVNPALLRYIFNLLSNVSQIQTVWPVIDHKALRIYHMLA